MRAWGKVWSRGIAAGLAVLMLAALSACNDDSAVPVTESSSAPTTTAPDPTSSQGDQPSSTPPPVRNDLAKLPLRRTINAGSLTVNIEYNTRLGLDDWQAERPKPLHVSLTSVNKKKNGQKIYLSRLTATVTAYNEGEQIGDSRSVDDTANITPGFIVTFPNTYNQDLTLPAVDSSSTSMTVDITYELVLEVDKTKQGNRDFAKQVATDTIVVPVPG